MALKKNYEEALEILRAPPEITEEGIQSFQDLYQKYLGSSDDSATRQRLKDEAQAEFFLNLARAGFDYAGAPPLEGESRISTLARAGLSPLVQSTQQTMGGYLQQLRELDAAKKQQETALRHTAFQSALQRQQAAEALEIKMLTETPEVKVTVRDGWTGDIAGTGKEYTGVILETQDAAGKVTFHTQDGQLLENVTKATEVLKPKVVTKPDYEGFTINADGTYTLNPGVVIERTNDAGKLSFSTLVNDTEVPLYNVRKKDTTSTRVNVVYNITGELPNGTSYTGTAVEKVTNGKVVFETPAGELLTNVTKQDTQVAPATIWGIRNGQATRLHRTFVDGTEVLTDPDTKGPVDPGAFDSFLDQSQYASWQQDENKVTNAFNVAVEQLPTIQRKMSLEGSTIGLNWNPTEQSFYAIRPGDQAKPGEWEKLSQEENQQVLDKLQSRVRSHINNITKTTLGGGVEYSVDQFEDVIKEFLDRPFQDVLPRSELFQAVPEDFTPRNVRKINAEVAKEAREQAKNSSVFNVAKNIRDNSLVPTDPNANRLITATWALPSALQPHPVNDAYAIQDRMDLEYGLSRTSFPNSDPRTWPPVVIAATETGTKMRNEELAQQKGLSKDAQEGLDTLLSMSDLLHEHKTLRLYTRNEGVGIIEGRIVAGAARLGLTKYVADYPQLYERLKALNMVLQDGYSRYMGRTWFKDMRISNEDAKKWAALMASLQIGEALSTAQETLLQEGIHKHLKAFSKLAQKAGYSQATMQQLSDTGIYFRDPGPNAFYEQRKSRYRHGVAETNWVSLSPGRSYIHGYGDQSYSMSKQPIPVVSDWDINQRQSNAFRDSVTLVVQNQPQQFSARVAPELERDEKGELVFKDVLLQNKALLGGEVHAIHQWVHPYQNTKNIDNLVEGVINNILKQPDMSSEQKADLRKRIEAGYWQELFKLYNYVTTPAQ